MDKQVQKEIAELSEIIREKDGGKKYAKAKTIIALIKSLIIKFICLFLKI